MRNSAQRRTEREPRRAAPPRLPLRRELARQKGLRGATEGERTRDCCLHKGVGVHKIIQVSLLLSARLYLLLSHTLGVSLLPSRRFNPLYAAPPPSSEGGEGAPAPTHRFNYLCKACKYAPPHKNVPLRAARQNYSFFTIHYSLEQSEKPERRCAEWQ